MPEDWYFEVEKRKERAFGIDSFPVLRFAHRRLSPAQIATLFSAPVVIVPAAPGRVVIPESVRVRKAAGTIWVTAGSGQLEFSWLGLAGPFPFALFDQAHTTAFFGADQALWIATQGSGSTVAAGNKGPCGVQLDQNLLRNRAIDFRLHSADISGGSGVLDVDVWYREWKAF